MSHLLKTTLCDLCGNHIHGQTFYIHNPPNCGFYHANALEEAKKNHQMRLASNIANVTVGGGSLAVAAGRLATAGKVGSMTGKAIGGALAAVGIVTSVIGIVDAATETAPELPKCSKCSSTEAEQPGCILFCNMCGHESDSWLNATKEKHCLQICSDCKSMDVCFNCNQKSSSIASYHRNSNVADVHGTLSTHLYGTCKAARITGDSLTIAGTAVTFIPVIGWFAGPALIAGGVGTNIGAAAASKPIVKVKCGSCNREEIPDEFDKVKGCRRFCICCGVSASKKSKFCVRLCRTCKNDIENQVC